LIRAKKRNLTISRSITSTEGDLLLASGVSNHVITSWFSQGIEHHAGIRNVVTYGSLHRRQRDSRVRRGKIVAFRLHRAADTVDGDNTVCDRDFAAVETLVSNDRADSQPRRMFIEEHGITFFNEWRHAAAFNAQNAAAMSPGIRQATSCPDKNQAGADEQCLAENCYEAPHAGFPYPYLLGDRRTREDEVDAADVRVCPCESVGAHLNLCLVLGCGAASERVGQCQAAGGITADELVKG